MNVQNFRYISFAQGIAMVCRNGFTIRTPYEFHWIELHHHRNERLNQDKKLFKTNN